MEMIRLAQFICLVAMVYTCSPPEGWKTQTMLERVESSKVLVYGEVKEIIDTETSRGDNVEYRIDVSCVLRNEADSSIYIGGTVSVYESDPTGECVSNRHAMSVGKKVILMLTNHYQDEEKLKFQNINVQQAVFEGNEANLDTIAQTCQFKRMMAPSDSVNKQCPAQAQRDACATTMSTASCCYPVILTVLCLILVITIKQWL